MSKVSLLVGNKLAPYFGVLINLFVVSIPLFFVDVGTHFVGFLSNPVMLTFYSLISIFCFLESKASVYSSDALSTNNEKHFLPYLASASVLLVFWASISSHANSHNLDSYLQLVVASLIVLSGVLIRTVSIKVLNQFFVSHVGLTKNHQLVKTGLYSLVRHPSELGLLLICFGVPMLMSSLVGLCCTLLLVLPLSIYRISLEDKIINATFGKDFVTYKSSVPALIPNLLQRKRTC